MKVSPHKRAANCDRDSILFLGSFNGRKKNDVAISAFDKACNSIPPNVKFVLVGNGPAKEQAIAHAHSLPNRHRIVFEPGTINEDVIQGYYSRALASVSFGQAGLSALQSLGHGVPFITMRDAISGGEIENIKNDETGILCDQTEEALTEAFVRICNDREFADRLGMSALEYYSQRCTVECMAKGFIGAVENEQLISAERVGLKDSSSLRNSSRLNKS